jgi:AraC family transcriptional regulator of arabinose operon
MDVRGIVSRYIYGACNQEFTMVCRPCNQLCYFVSGKRKYYINNEEIISASPGDILIMPTSSSYKSIVVSEDNCINLGILFTIIDETQTEVVPCSTIRYLCNDLNGTYFLQMKKIHEYSNQGGIAFLKAKSLFLSILYDLIQTGAFADTEKQVGSIATVIRYMEENLQQAISIDDLAEMCFMSRSTFYRRFRDVVGESPASFHRNLRIQKCKTLLKTGEYSVEQVADIMGFSDTSYFSRAFYKHTGMYASQYRGNTEKYV